MSSPNSTSSPEAQLLRQLVRSEQPTYHGGKWFIVAGTLLEVVALVLHMNGTLSDTSWGMFGLVLGGGLLLGYGVKKEGVILRDIDLIIKQFALTILFGALALLTQNLLHDKPLEWIFGGASLYFLGNFFINFVFKPCFYPESAFNPPPQRPQT